MESSGKVYTQVDDFSALFGPPNDDKVWRYMSLGALLNVLVRGQLYFARADQFNDMYEGTVPGHETQAVSMQKRAFISCWNKSDNESYSLWKAYAGLNEGVAIQSTHRRLLSSISAGLTPAPVIYLDHRHDRIDVAAWPYHFLQKDKQFEDEKEFRLLIVDPKSQYQFERFGYEFVYDEKNEILGIYVTINAQQLIERIVVAPRAPHWFTETLSRLVDGSIPVSPSSLARRVRY